MKDYRVTVWDPESQTWRIQEGTVKSHEWRKAGTDTAQRLGVSADWVAVEVDTKVGFVRCTI